MWSPFRPGFGKPPTVLAGRSELADELYEAVTEDAPDHRAVVGPRGVGKSVLLREVERRLHNAGDAVVVWQSCDSKQATSEVLARTIIETTRRLAPWWESFGRALSERLSVGFDAVAQINLQPRPGEDFHPDSILTTTIDSLGQAARDARTQVVVFLDEVQSLQGTPSSFGCRHSCPIDRDDARSRCWNLLGRRPPLPRDSAARRRSRGVGAAGALR